MHCLFSTNNFVDFIYSQMYLSTISAGLIAGQGDILHQTEADLIFNFLDEIYLNLKFTLDKETDYMLLIIDVLVHRIPLHYVTSIYCKPISMGLYT